MPMITSVDEAVKNLSAEGVVAIPTETVYGLAGRIDSNIALQKIFSTKQRPFFDPLIVHVANINQARELVTTWPDWAQSLAEKFWPGPLTLVLPKNDKVSDLITSGLPTVALRYPNHTVALEIINKVKVPLAAPSANMFGRTSPTLAVHVEQEFNGAIAVVDGGSCQVGIESTVVKQVGSEKRLQILRPGMITIADLASALPNWKIDVLPTAESPGHLKHHYQPQKPLILLKKDWCEDSHQLICRQLEKPITLRPIALTLPSEPALAARELYSRLRNCDQLNGDYIYIVLQEDTTPHWAAICDRLEKAATFII